jgi:hypothetical protein
MEKEKSTRLLLYNAIQSQIEDNLLTDVWERVNDPAWNAVKTVKMIVLAEVREIVANNLKSMVYE